MTQTIDHINIRKYQPKDRKVLRRISYETSFLEKADDIFDEPELLADALTLYFTDSEPESCFVATANDKVVGYLIGARNEREMDRVSWVKIYPRILWVAIIRGLFLKTKTFNFLYGIVNSLLKGEFRAPDFSEEYPAVLHINIARNYRGAGVGQKLIEAYCEHLKEYHVKGVRAPTMSEPAKRFFERCGFQSLFTTSRSYLHYYFRKDIPVYIMGRRLL